MTCPFCNRPVAAADLRCAFCGSMIEAPLRPGVFVIDGGLRMSEEILHADANAAELARTRAELTALRAAYDQAERALDAERAARRGAEADVAALREILTAFERSVNESVSGIRRHSADEWLLLLGKAQGVGGEHPGASLLAELAAAQAVIKTLRAWMTREARLSALEAALAKYDQVRGGQADGSS